MKITHIKAREIFDSRGCPTVECELYLDNGMTTTASVPTGLSRSHHEAYELRDGGSRLGGMGVTKAVENIEKIIAPALIGKEPNGPTLDIAILDLDTMPDKSRLGANAILAVSMAVYKAQAIFEQIELYELLAYLCGAETISVPLPQFNFINGGVHADNGLPIQEFLILPVGASSFRSAMEIGVTLFQELKTILRKKGKSTAVGDEGGFAAQFASSEEAIECLVEAMERVGKSDDSRCVIGLDFAATQYYDSTSTLYSWNNKKLSSLELIEAYQTLLQTYPVYSIEDPLAEDDWVAWQTLMTACGSEIQIIGDDIFATNFYRIEEGIKQGLANAVLIKPNQIGTITETLQAIQLCKQNNMKTVVSHRSGETNDSFIADLAVGASAGQIKAGGCSRGERLAKYNRLLAIEDQLLQTFGSLD